MATLHATIGDQAEKIRDFEEGHACRRQAERIRDLEARVQYEKNDRKKMKDIYEVTPSIICTTFISNIPRFKELIQIEKDKEVIIWMFVERLQTQYRGFTVPLQEALRQTQEMAPRPNATIVQVIARMQARAARMGLSTVATGQPQTSPASNTHSLHLDPNAQSKRHCNLIQSDSISGTCKALQ
jgi:hypothetical protein